MGVRKVVRGPALVVLGVLLLQAAWILTMPPFRGIDEFDHAFRAAAVARGEWVAGEAAEDGRGRLVVVPRSLVEAAHAQCDVLDYTGPDNCSPVESVSGGNVTVASAAASYHPVFYWVIGTAARPFDGATSLYAMRIATALLSVLFIGLAAWSVAKLPGRWPLAGLILAITPVFLYSTTVAAPNGVEMSAGLALWGTLLALIHGQSGRTETRLLWGAILAAVVLGMLRVLGPVFILMIVATVVSLDWGAARELIRRQRRSVLVGCFLVGASVVGQAAWMLDTIVQEVAGEGRSSPKVFSAFDIVGWPLQSIAAFPLSNQPGATIVYPVVAALVVGLVAAAFRHDRTRVRKVMLASLAATLLFPFVYTLATLDSIGNIWQGRYMLPYGVGFLLLGGLALGRHTKSGPATRVLVPAALAYGFAIAACLIKVRSDELSDNPATLGDSGWNAPSQVLLIALVGMATALFVHALAVRDQQRLGTTSVPRPARLRPTDA